MPNQARITSFHNFSKSRRANPIKRSAVLLDLAYTFSRRTHYSSAGHTNRSNYNAMRSILSYVPNILKRMQLTAIGIKPCPIQIMWWNSSRIRINSEHGPFLFSSYLGLFFLAKFLTFYLFSFHIEKKKKKDEWCK